MTGRSWRGLRLRYAAPVCAAVAAVAASSSCYSTGTGTPPPMNTFYYPVGLAVSAAGNVLYVANSDFDLQWNGGTVQSYDLNAIRIDTVRLMLGLFTYAVPFDAGSPAEAGNDSGVEDAGGEAGLGDAGLEDAGGDVGVDAGTLPFVPVDAGPLPFEAGILAATAFSNGCPVTSNLPAPPNPNDPNGWNGQPGRLPIGQTCAPPMDSTYYYRDGIVTGAFATDAQLSKNQGRLFVPVRGDATLTWMDVQNDDDPRYVAGSPPPAPGETLAKLVANYPPFALNCNRDSITKRCDEAHHAGQASDPGNTRGLAMPGEPFAMAFSEDGTAIAMTHLSPDALNLVAADTSLFLTGFVPNSEPDGGVATDDGGSTANLGTNSYDPSMQFYADNMPLGGDGIVAIPHDPVAIANLNSADPVRPAWLQVSNATSEIDLLRYYTNEGYQSALDAGLLVDAGVATVEGAVNLRPFIVKERAYGNAVEANGSNNRGIAIDTTPRIACEQAVLDTGAPVTSPEYVQCAQTPARVFIASRSPPSLIIGQIGGMAEEGGRYDPDALVLYGDVSLSAGPSSVYIAPIVDKTGRYSVRVFVVCFDSQTIAIYDPDTGGVDQVTTGPGPFAMAFDPFDITAVATHAPVAFDPRSKYTVISKGHANDGELALRKYRFAYVASFTDSYVQVLDLDESFQDDRLKGVSTYETMVYSLGLPVQPVQAN
jgi:hypothetical protein